MLGTIINVIAITLGGLLGLLLRKRTPRSVGERIMQGFGLFSVAIGLGGAIGAENPLLIILSLIVGAAAGELLHLESRLDGFTMRLEARFFSGESGGDFKEGFISCTILFCIGAMSIVGPFNAVLKGDYNILYIKSALDGVTAFIFASNYGVSVLLAGGSVLLYQGLFTLLALFLKDFLSGEAIAAMSVIGSLLIAGVGFNLLDFGKKRISLVNLLPAVFVPLLYGPVLVLAGWARSVLPW